MKVSIPADQPLVSVIIPCRNEEKFIVPCLDSIIANDYPKDRLEVLVIDGMSVDATRSTVERYTSRYPYIRLLDNPRRVTPTALNIGIKGSGGAVIIRMDAHSEYPSTFVSKCIEHLNKTDSDVVGGPVITKPSVDTLIGRNIAFITSHPFGVGNSSFRTSNVDGYVDTVPFGAYRRDVFKKIGLFDERLARNQDNELMSRIISSGGKIYLSTDLAVTYYNQGTLRGLIRQALKTGMWNAATLKINRAAFRWRHFVPFAFVTAILVLGLLAFLSTGMMLAFLALLGVYVGPLLVSSLQIGIRRGPQYAVFAAPTFLLYHVSYGLGTWAGLLRLTIGQWKGTSGRPENDRG